MSYFDGELGYDQAREFRDTMASFLDHPGWKVFSELLAARALLREKELYAMCPASIEQMVTFAKLKGGIEECQLIPEIVGHMLSDVDNQVRSYQDELAEQQLDLALEMEN